MMLFDLLGYDYCGLALHVILLRAANDMRLSAMNYLCYDNCISNLINSAANILFYAYTWLSTHGCEPII